MRHGGSHRGCARTNATLRPDSNRIPRARHSQKAKQLRIPERKTKKMMRRRSTERRERESHSQTHTDTHTHPAVENHAVDLRLIQRLTKRDTTLSSRKKKVQKNKGISKRFLVSFIILVIFFPCTWGILLQF